MYMKKVTDSAASNNAAGPGWFKIMEDGYDSNAGLWCTEKLIQANGLLAAQIPSTLAPGYYLMRPELLALHQADKHPPDPQFYVGCAQVFVSSNGNSQPDDKDTVSIPGYVNMDTPAMTYDIWTVPLKLPFPDFGPPLYNGSSSSTTKRDLESRDTAAVQNIQTVGLKPANCVMQNGNWCGFVPPSYNDQTTCYTLSPLMPRTDICQLLDHISKISSPKLVISKLFRPNNNLLLQRRSHRFQKLPQLGILLHIHPHGLRLRLHDPRQHHRPAINRSIPSCSTSQSSSAE